MRKAESGNQNSRLDLGADAGGCAPAAALGLALGSGGLVEMVLGVLLLLFSLIGDRQGQLLGLVPRRRPEPARPAPTQTVSGLGHGCSPVGILCRESPVRPAGATRGNRSLL